MPERRRRSDAGQEAPRDAIASLRDKYDEMLRLRLDDVRGDGVDPRSAMRVLAARFPGALRELDELPLEVLQGRRDALSAVIGGETDAPEWALLFVRYHGWMRAVLRIKRLCVGARDLAEACSRVAQSYRAQPDEPPAERFDQETVRAIVTPSGGRLNPWVFERVADEHDVDAAHVARVLFPKVHNG